MEGGVEATLAKMASIGTDLNREDVLECYNDRILRLFLTEQGEQPSASALFARLQKAVDARAEIHELERGMDKAHFVEIVTSGNFMASGIDKQTKSPIFWFRDGRLNINSWSYVYNSPRGKAFIRYAV